MFYEGFAHRLWEPVITTKSDYTWWFPMQNETDKKRAGNFFSSFFIAPRKFQNHSHYHVGPEFQTVIKKTDSFTETQNVNHLFDAKIETIIHSIQNDTTREVWHSFLQYDRSASFYHIRQDYLIPPLTFHEHRSSCSMNVMPLSNFKIRL